MSRAPHQMVVGPTGAGKSSLERELARRWRAAIHVRATGERYKRGVIVQDHHGDPRWEVDHVGTDPDRTLAVVRDSLECEVIVDEAHRYFGELERDRHAGWWEVPFEGRHSGHRLVFSSLRPTMIAKSVRAMCGSVWTFYQGVDEARVLAKDFHGPKCSAERVIEVVTSLGDYEYALLQSRVGVVGIARTSPHW